MTQLVDMRGNHRENSSGIVSSSCYPPIGPCRLPLPVQRQTAIRPNGPKDAAVTRSERRWQVQGNRLAQIAVITATVVSALGR